MMRAVVDLPDPDSPTMPREPPARSVKPISSTATNSSRPPRGERTWKVLRSPSTASTGSAGARSVGQEIGRKRRREQPDRVGVGGILTHRRSLKRLHRAPVLHDGDTIADRTGEREIVGDEQERKVAVAAEVGDHGHDLLLRRHVESGRDLVREQDRRVHRQGRRDHHPLQQSAGQVTRALPHAAVGIGDADLGEKLHRAPSRGIRLLSCHGHERLGHEVADRAQRVEVGARRLEDHAQAARADVAQPLRRHGRDVLAVDADRAADPEVVGQQPGDGPHRQGLARARLADESERFARPHLQGAVLDEQPGVRRRRARRSRRGRVRGRSRSSVGSFGPGRDASAEDVDGEHGDDDECRGEDRLLGRPGEQ